MSRTKFKIPDLPATRPKVPEVRALIRAYYSKPGNEVGGNLHVVLDDNNLRISDIAWARDHAAAANDQDGVAISDLLLQMTPSQRRRATRI